MYICLITMWEKIKNYFEGSPSKLKVAKLLVEMGFRINEEGNIFCGDVQIQATKIAEAIHIDRRVVTETAKAILDAADLKQLFLHLKPAGPLLRDVAKYLGYGVVEIRAQPDAPGIIAEAATLLSRAGISIRQILAEDAEIYPDPILIIITDHNIPGELIHQFLHIPTVQQVTIS